MSAGKYRHRITIERREKSYDRLGHEQAEWKAIASNHPAKVTELTGRELERARQLVAEVTVSVTTRRSPAVEKDRILFRGRILNILGVTNDERGTEQTLLCAEIRQG